MNHASSGLGSHYLSISNISNIHERTNEDDGLIHIANDQLQLSMANAIVDLSLVI